METRALDHFLSGLLTISLGDKERCEVNAVATPNDYLNPSLYLKFSTLSQYSSFNCFLIK